MYIHEELISKNSEDEGDFVEIATIDLPDDDESLEEDSVVGNFNLKGTAKQCKILVYSKEGPVQHFHIKGQNIDSCICIFLALYANHGVHQDYLTNNQAKILNEKLKEKSKFDGNKTIWEYIATLWYMNNPENPTKYPNAEKVRTNIQPDYTMINVNQLALQHKAN